VNVHLSRISVIRLVAMLCFVLMAAGLRAQITSTTMLGTVTDVSGAVVANARVTATNTGTGLSRSVQTNDQGQYRLEVLPTGEYRVEVTAQGFKTFVRSGVVLTINVDSRVDASMQVGGVSETVTVTGDAPLINTSNASIGRTVSPQEITQLPLVNRNIYSFLTLTPGVDSSQNTIVLGYPEQRTMINGGVDGGAGSVNYYLDGGTNMTGLRNTGNIAPNPDAVEEFRVITNNYDAEYGRFAGGVINIITHSGTNDFHGSLFEFLRNTNLNANTWLALSKPPLHRNQFGGSIGGPIKKNKTFFFGTYSGLRQITNTFMNTAVVPTALERQGNFSQSNPKPRGFGITNNVIPASSLDPTALNILNKYIPLANSPGNIFQGQVPSPYDTDEYLAKVDHSLTDTHRLSVSYYETSGNTLVIPGLTASGNAPANSLPWSQQQFTWRQHNANLSDTWAISPATINQFWVSYTRNFGGRLNLPQLSLGDLGSKFQVQGTPSLPQISVSGFFTLTQAIAGPVAGTNFYSVRDVLSNTRGRHSLRFGFEESLNKDVQQTLLNNYGTFSFTGVKSGNALADFLLGMPVTMNQDAPITALDNFWYTGAFVQDDFRIHPRLTLNFGLRYDFQTPPTDPHDRTATFELGKVSQVLKNVPSGMLFPGDPGVTRGIIPARKANFAPRLGIAWDPSGDGKTSIRAGAGLFWGSVSGNEWNSPSNFQPFAVRQQFNTVASLTNPYGALPGGVSPFPYSYSPQNPQFIFPASIFGISPDFRWPYSYQLNFSVQRQITKDFSMTAAYVGTLNHDLPFAVDINYPLYNTTATSSNVNNRRPIQPGTLASIQLDKSIMNANYHGLQITAEKRMGHHFGLKSFYVFSKAISDVQLQNNTTNGSAQNFNNLSEERGRTDFDRRHNFVTSLIWQIDYFNGSNALVRNVLNGWEVTGIVTFQSGLPFTVTSGRDVNLDGNNNDRPSLIGDPHLDPNRSRNAVSNLWFNPAAFIIPANGVDGNAGRNILDGPGSRNVDIGLFRNFKIHERIALQARAEATNAFNLVNLNNPTSSLSNLATAGTIRTAKDMRQVQMGLRLTF
jgi:hypothetical protein